MVVETAGPRTYVGRFDSEEEGVLHLHDVAVHEDAEPRSKDEFLRRSLRFGVPAQHRHVAVPRAEVTRITRLGELDA